MSNFFRLVMLFIVFATSLDAYAQTDSDPTAASRMFAGPLAWGLVCYLMRKRAFGGWLLYFYAGLLTSIFIILMGVVMTYDSLSPTFWIDRSGYYLLYLAYTMPDLIVGLLVWLLAVRMLFKSQRNKKNLGYFRKLLLVNVLCSFVSVIIVLVFGGELLADPSPFLDIWGIGVALLITIYFYRSQRVQVVLGDNYWDYQRFRIDGARPVEPR